MMRHFILMNATFYTYDATFYTYDATFYTYKETSTLLSQGLKKS